MFILNSCISSYINHGVSYLGSCPRIFTMFFPYVWTNLLGVKQTRRTLPHVWLPADLLLTLQCMHIIISVSNSGKCFTFNNAPCRVYWFIQIKMFQSSCVCSFRKKKCYATNITIKFSLRIQFRRLIYYLLLCLISFFFWRIINELK